MVGIPAQVATQEVLEIVQAWEDKCVNQWDGGEKGKEEADTRGSLKEELMRQVLFLFLTGMERKRALFQLERLEE